MIAKDCFWEINNLGDPTLEITIEDNDLFHNFNFSELEKGYSYIVVKVPVSHADFNFGLSRLGYTFIETQFHVTKSFKSFNDTDRLIQRISRDLQFKDITTDTEKKELLDSITDGMFSTDRVTLDPRFGLQAGRKRYVNWLSSDIEKKNTILYEYIYSGNRIGFSYLVEKDRVLDYALGGIYKPFQSWGLGLLTPASPFLYCASKGLSFDKIETHISSNNSVFRFYHYLGYNIEDMSYVFIKHVDD